MTKEELPFCECGCGERVSKVGNRYVKGHQWRRYPKPKPQLCDCGCGELTNPGNRFINHHNNARLGTGKPISEAKLCNCGCGELTLPGNNYINGHNMKGKEYTLDHCNAISEGKLRKKDPLPNDWKIDKTCKMAINKKCSMYLGCYISEYILSKIFKNVQRMPHGNPGFDFICGNGYKIDVKSSATGNKGYWQFTISKNKIPDFFLCLAFEDREDLTPTHLWLIPGKDINHRTMLVIKKSDINKLEQYEQSLDKVIVCCNKMKGESQ